MGTKNNPGEFDCYENAEPDEPMFVLLGRDLMAPLLVRKWADIRIAAYLNSSDDDQIVEALACADAMEEYRNQRITRLAEQAGQ